MTINGLVTLLEQRKSLIAQKAYWEDELKNVDNIRAIRFYQPNPTRCSPRPSTDECYSSLINEQSSFDEENMIFEGVRATYKGLLEQKISALESNIASINALIDKAEGLLADLVEGMKFIN